MKSDLKVYKIKDVENRAAEMYGCMAFYADGLWNNCKKYNCKPGVAHPDLVFKRNMLFNQEVAELMMEKYVSFKTDLLRAMNGNLNELQTFKCVFYKEVITNMLESKPNN